MGTLKQPCACGETVSGKFDFNRDCCRIRWLKREAEIKPKQVPNLLKEWASRYGKSFADKARKEVYGC